MAALRAYAVIPVYKAGMTLNTLSTASLLHRFQNNKFIVGCYRRAPITENLLQLVEIVEMAVRHNIPVRR